MIAMFLPQKSIESSSEGIHFFRVLFLGENTLSKLECFEILEKSGCPVQLMQGTALSNVFRHGYQWERKPSAARKRASGKKAQNSMVEVRHHKTMEEKMEDKNEIIVTVHSKYRCQYRFVFAPRFSRKNYRDN